MPQPSELLNDVKIVLDISSRIDERVKMLQTTQQETQARLHQLLGEINQVSSRVTVLESKSGVQVNVLSDDLVSLRSKVERIDITGTEAFRREWQDIQQDNEILEDRGHKILNRVKMLESANDSWQEKAKKYGALIIQGVWAIIMAYILFKLGLSHPSH